MWYDEKVVFLIAYFDAHQKSSCLSEIYVSVDNICSNKLWRNSEERFCLEILSWDQRSGNKNKPPLQWIIICCRVYFLSLLSFTHESAETEKHLEKFITNAETYLEPRQISTMELFGLIVSTKKFIIDFRLGSKYASVMEEDIWK